ncbi:hypothetical protein G9A89_001572 [Geosiphon pyriformis]|nr:hypothetical protein G9A89_001572 [Geosiphon pyriformis]
MSKKRAPKGAFHSLADGSFLQKKKVMLGNVKHSNDKKNISLNKSELGDNVFFNVDSVSGDKKNTNMTGINIEFLIDLAANTPKAKHVNTGAIFSSPLRFPNFVMDNDEDVSFFPYLSIFLKKKWIDPKIIKTQVEVSAKKSFAFDINLSAVEGKSAMTKTHMVMAISLARKKEIIVNTNLKKQRICSNQTVVIKEIPMDTPKKMIVTALVEFGEIKLIKIQLIELWQKAVVEFAELDQIEQLAIKWFFLIGKDSVQVAMAVGDRKTWVLRDQFRALLFTLPVKTIAHNLGIFLKRVGRKTCIINCLLDSGNKIHCAVIGFESEDVMEFAYRTEPIFGGIKLSWARLDLVCCKKCNHLGHSALKYNAPTLLIADSSKIVKRLAKLYTKKCVLISRSAVFSGKFWVQVVSLAFPPGNPYFNSGFRFDSPSSGFSDIKGNMSVIQNDSSINDHLASLECSLELLANQISDIVHRLNGVELVPLVPIIQVVSTATLVSTLALMDTDMVLDVPQSSLPFFFSVLKDRVADLGLSSSKVLISKVGGLESKMIALEVSIGLILGKLDLLYINQGSLMQPLHQ